jgi:hypothetical protein
MPRTGHLGLITRAEDFAAVVAPFVERAAGEERSGSLAPGSGRGRLPGAGRKVG